MAKTTKSRANAATNGTTAAAPANDTAPKVPNDAAVTSTGGDFHPSSPTRRRPAATVPNDGAVALGLEPWQLWVEDDRVSLGTLLLRTLVDTTEPGGDVVGGPRHRRARLRDPPRIPPRRDDHRAPAAHCFGEPSRVNLPRDRFATHGKLGLWRSAPKTSGGPQGL
jgi:hypothetical protein